MMLVKILFEKEDHAKARRRKEHRIKEKYLIKGTCIFLIIIP